MLILHRALGLFGLLGRLLWGGPAITLAPSAPHATSRRFAASRRLRRPSKLYKPNGARECARRRRQIALGQLRVSA